MIGLAAALCAGMAIWCSLGTIGLVGPAAVGSRVALLPPWWLVPLLVMALFGTIRLLRLSPRQQSPLFGSVVALLPWLPGPLPAAALIWTGPFLIAVWAAVVVGVIARRLGAARASWLMDPRRAAITATVLSLALYLAAAIWLSPILPDGDEPHYLILAQSLLKDGDLKIENNHRQGDYLAYSLTAAAPDYLRRGANGEIYSIHAPGLPALIAPAMWLFGYPGVVVFLAVIAALSSALVWSIGFRLTGSSAAAWFGWASAALTTPFFFQATEVFPDGIAATFLLLGTLPLYDDARNRPKPTLLTTAGAALAVLPWLQTRLAVLAAAAALCVVWRLRSARQLFAFIAVPAVVAAAWFGVFFVVYGTPNPTAPYGPYTQTSLGNLVRGVPGLLFDQQFGLIPNAPVYGFILTGTLAALVTLRRWSFETLVMTVPYMTAVGTYQMWWGGTSVPARLLTPMTLVLGIAAARVWRHLQSPATRALGLLALIVSAVITATLLGPDHGRLLLNFRDGISLWVEYANDVVDLPRGLPSLFRDARSVLWLKVAIWAAAMTILWIVWQFVASRRSLRDSNQPAITGGAIWCTALAVMVAFTLAWRADGVPPLTPTTAELTLLRHASTFRSHAFDFAQWQTSTPSALLTGQHITTDERRPSNPPTLFAVHSLPAGEYALSTSPGESRAGVLTVHAGLTELPFLQLAAGDQPAAGSRIRLVSRIRSLTITGDAEARRSPGALSLMPLNIWSPTGDDAEAHRAARYEPADVFFFDEHAYPEATGFWVAGARTAEFVVAPRSGRVDLFVRNAPVENHVTITAAGEVRDLQLRPGEEQLIQLPSTHDASPIRLEITTSNGFRPALTEPGSTDQRYVSCWLEVR